MCVAEKAFIAWRIPAERAGVPQPVAVGQRDFRDGPMGVSLRWHA
jgi:hypothetical protein